MPAHCRMRAYDRDLIRGGHYGQRPRVPHLKAEHMAAPTKAANVKKVLANSEPSTHGTKRPCETLGNCSTATFKVKLVASIAMKDQMRFAIREGGKIGGVGVAAKTIA